MKKYRCRNCPQGIVLSFMSILLFAGLFAAGIASKEQKKIYPLIIFGVLGICLSILEFIILIKCNRRYQLCIKNGQPGKGVVTQIFHRSNKYRVIAHYLVVKFQSNGVEYLTEVQVGESTVQHVMIGTEIPLLIYDKYAILG